MGRRQRSAPMLALAAVAIALAGCADDEPREAVLEAEPGFEVPETAEGRLATFCAPLTVDPDSADPVGDFARRVVATPGPEGDDATARAVVELVAASAPADLAASASVLEDGIGRILDGDPSALDSPEVRGAIGELNAGVLDVCPEPRPPGTQP